MVSVLFNTYKVLKISRCVFTTQILLIHWKIYELCKWCCKCDKFPYSPYEALFCIFNSRSCFGPLKVALLTSNGTDVKITASSWPSSRGSRGHAESSTGNDQDHLFFVPFIKYGITVTHKHIKTLGFHVLKCWMFCFEGWVFSCSLDVLHEGLGINKLPFLSEAQEDFYISGTCAIYSLYILYKGRVIRPNCSFFLSHWRKKIFCWITWMKLLTRLQGSPCFATNPAR